VSDSPLDLTTFHCWIEFLLTPLYTNFKSCVHIVAFPPQSGACGTGKLVGLDTRIQTIAGMNTAHYEERVKKNGKRTIDDTSTAGNRRRSSMFSPSRLET
jgi:hypothetical protein